jgi:hypothetical protein
MAIGKVGSYATVQTPQVDFGFERAFDRLRQDEDKAKASKAKEAELAQKRQEDVAKNILGAEPAKQSGIAPYDKSSNIFVSEGREELNNIHKEMISGNISVAEGKMRQQAIIDRVKQLNESTTVLTNNYDQFVKDDVSGKYNKAYSERYINALQTANEGRVAFAFENGKMLVQEFDEEGNPVSEPKNFNDWHNEIKDVPFAWDLTSNIKKTQEAITKDVRTSAPNALYSIKRSDIEKSPTALSAISNVATQWSNDDNAMAEYFVSNGKGLKSKGFTDEEREEAKSFFEKQIIDSYGKEVTETRRQETRPGPKDKEEVVGSIEPTPFRLRDTKTDKITYETNKAATIIGGEFKINNYPTTLKSGYINKEGNVVLNYTQNRSTSLNMGGASVKIGSSEKEEIKGKWNSNGDLDKIKIALNKTYGKTPPIELNGKEYDLKDFEQFKAYLNALDGGDNSRTKTETSKSDDPEGLFKSN